MEEMAGKHVPSVVRRAESRSISHIKSPQLACVPKPKRNPIRDKIGQHRKAAMRERERGG